MDGITILSIVASISTIASAVIAVFSLRKSKTLQIVLNYCKETHETTVSLRNIGSKIVFIDRIELYKSYLNTIDLSEKFGRLGPLPPGSQFSVSFSEGELKGYLDQIVKETRPYIFLDIPVDKTCCKIQTISSEGKGVIGWIGLGKPFSHECYTLFSLSGFLFTVFHVRNRYDTNRLVLPVVMTGLITFIVLLFGECNTLRGALLFILSFASLFVSMMILARSGTSNKLLLLVASVVLGLIITLFFLQVCYSNLTVVTILSVFSFLLIHSTLERSSGWDCSQRQSITGVFIFDGYSV